MRHLYFGSMRGDLQEGTIMLPGANPLSSRAQNRHFCVRVTEDAYGDVGLEVVNMGFGKRKARMFWVCALLLIYLAARSAILPRVPFYPECHSTRSAALPGVPPHHLLARKRRAGARRAGERRAGGFTGGRG